MRRVRQHVRSSIHAVLLLSFAASSPLAQDCNHNGTVDELDISGGRSRDCDGDGVPDECQLRFGVRLDAPASRLELDDPQEAPTTLPHSPRLLTTDLNQDGHPDLVWLDVMDATGRMSVFLNRGSGVFASSWYEIGRRVRSLVEGDLDGDGDADVLALALGTLFVFSNRGDGTFGEPVIVPVPDGAFGMALGDVDGDRASDVVLTDKNRDSVVIIPNRLGALGDPLEIPAGGDLPLYVTLADFDGDGALDLATGNRRSETVSILFNFGDGVFAREAVVDAPGPPRQLLPADFSGDGLADLLVGSDSQLLVLEIAPNGEVSRSTPLGPWEPPLSYLTAEDIDADGDLDLLVTGGESPVVRVFLNAGDGSFGGWVDLDTTGLSRPIRTLSAADYDGDGDLDLAVTIEEKSEIWILWQNEPDTLSILETEIDLEQLPAFVVPADFNGDGISDLAAVGEGTVEILLNDGEGDLEPLFSPYQTGPGRVGNALVGDLDGDGSNDLVLRQSGSSTLKVIFNESGDGNLATFGSVREIEVVRRLVRSALADLNGDGISDILTVSDHTPPLPAMAVQWLSVSLSAGRGHFQTARTLLQGNSLSAVLGTDLDGDGDTDLAVADSVQIWLLYNDGLGEFPETRHIPGFRRSISSLVNLDLDGDGDEDLVGEDYSATSFILENLGGGATNLIWPDSGRLSGTPADFDGDGLVDLIAYGTVHLNRGDLEFIDLRLPTGRPVDLDGDGDADFVRRSYDPPRLVRRINESRNSPTLPRCSVSFRRGDALGDGNVNVTDALTILDFLFGGDGGLPSALPCEKAADANDDGRIDLADPISLLLHLFGGAGVLAPPFEACGEDPTEDGLACGESSGC